MALSTEQQIWGQLKRSQNPLIVFQPKEIDGLASALALYLLLSQIGLKPEIACANFTTSPNISFLPNLDKIKPKLDSLQQLVVKLNVAKDKIKDFSYNFVDNKLHIFITPHDGGITSSDARITTSNYKHDLIITAGVIDLPSLGPLYQNNIDFFLATPIINIDCDPQNEQYGQINHVQINDTSTAETVYKLLRTNPELVLDDQIANCLLTGMIAKTQSFKSKSVTPETLHLASQLMDAGADREMIIGKLYRSRSVTTLNLWGRVLTKLKSAEQNKLVWSVLTADDFLSAGTEDHELDAVCEELISQMPSAQIFALLYQKEPGGLEALITSFNQTDLLQSLKSLKPSGTKFKVTIALKGTPIEAEQALTTELKKLII